MSVQMPTTVGSYRNKQMQSSPREQDAILANLKNIHQLLENQIQLTSLREDMMTLYSPLRQIKVV